MKSLFLTLCATSLTGAPHAFAQDLPALDPTGSPATPAGIAAGVTAIHTQSDDGGTAYGLWAAGDGYKVSFHDGMKFVPYLGRDHAVSRALRWKTLSARIGEHELVQHAPQLRHCELRAEYDLGQIVEAYDVRADGLEQTFVLESLPQKGGDLVIRGRFDGNLSPVMQDAGHRAVQLVDELSLPRVTYGAVTAVDAAGRRREMTTELRDGELVLRLDAGWLSQANLPIVVDPLIGPDLVSTSANVIGNVDVGYESTSSRPFWFAEVRYAASDDADLRIVRTTGASTQAVIVYSDLSDSWDSLEPSIGMSMSADRALTAFTRHFNANDERRVRMHMHDFGDLTANTSVVLLDPADDRNRWRPQVGSHLRSNGLQSLLVVFQTENTGAFANSVTSSIRGALYSLNGNGSLVDEFFIGGASLSDFERPTVADVDTAFGRRWTVAYQRYLNFTFGGTDNWDVEVVHVDDSSNVADATRIDGTMPNTHHMAPHIAGVADRLMLFYTESTLSESSSKPMDENGHRVRGARIDHDGNAFVQPYPSRVLNSTLTPRNVIAGVAFDANTESHWGMLLRSNVTDAINLRIYGYRGLEVHGQSVDSAPPFGSSVAGGMVYRTALDEFLMAYGINAPLSSSEVRVARWAWPTLSNLPSGPAACSAATIDWYGEQRAGTEFCGVEVDNAPANSFTSVVVGMSQPQVQLFGIDGVHDGCWLLVPLNGPDFLGLLGPKLGTSNQFQLSIPEGLPVIGLEMQAVVFDASAGEFFSTRRRSVEVGF